MDEVVSSILNIMHFHTFCFAFLSMYYYIPGTYLNIHAITLFDSVHATKSFWWQATNKCVLICHKYNTVHTMLEYDTPIYFNIPIHTSTFLLVQMVTILSKSHAVLTKAVCTCTENPVLCTNCLFLWKYDILRIVSSCTYPNGLSCSIAWYILGFTVHVLICYVYVLVCTQYILEQGGKDIQLSAYSAAGMSMSEVCPVLIR
jgi:hypothetical protein